MQLKQHRPGPDSSVAEMQPGTPRGPLATLAPQWHKLTLIALASGILAYGLSFLIPPTFTAKAVIISPQQQQNAAASALASVGALTGLSGLSGIKTPADQYVAVMRSTAVSNKLIAQFDLFKVYDKKYREETQRVLADSVRIAAGKKDNLITIEVDDLDPKRAAAIANAYVVELRELSNGLALSEAQLRRQFFEQHLKQSRDALTLAQAELQKTGIGPGAMKTEVRAIADTYARLKADVAAAEIRMLVLKKTMADSAPEVAQQNAALAGLRSQLARFEQPTETLGSQDYISAYRNYKYQETLFDIFARQYELARLDESREGTLIQILDPALPPELKSKPKRSTLAFAGMAFGLIAGSLFYILRNRRRESKNELGT